MTSYELYEMLQEMKEKDIFVMIGASIEYLIMVYGYDFKEVMKDLKNAHNFAKKNRNW